MLKIVLLAVGLFGLYQFIASFGSSMAAGAMTAGAGIIGLVIMGVLKDA